MGVHLDPLINLFWTSVKIKEVGVLVDTRSVEGKYQPVAPDLCSAKRSRLSVNGLIGPFRQDLVCAFLNQMPPMFSLIIGCKKSRRDLVP